MAVTIVQRTIGGVEKDAVVVAGAAETEEILLDEQLMAADYKFLDEVDSTTIEGNESATFIEKFAVAVLSIGISAVGFFAARTHLTTELQAAANKRIVAGDLVAAIQSLEDRVAALETAP
jgi:hypothetical protein